MKSKRITVAFFLCLVCATIGVGITWTWLNLGDVPKHGDSYEYVQISRTWKVDGYSGIVYPAVLFIVRLWHEDPDTVQYYRDVQRIQLFVFIISLGYFLYVLADRNFLREAGGRTYVALGTALLFLLLYFDPLLAHFSLSIMPDGLALSGSLIFCAAFADIGVRRSHPVVAGAALLLGYLLAAGIRVEKNIVLAVSTIIVTVIWIVVGCRHASQFMPELRRRAVLALLIVATGFSIVFCAHRALYEPSGRWPRWITVLQHRIIFPNLLPSYEHLPERLKEVISPETAQFYDARIHNTWPVMNQAAGYDPENLERLTKQLVIPVLKARWPAIFGSIVTDTMENVFAPFSFYSRLTLWIYGGEKESAFRVGFEGTSWTYHILAFAHPRLSKIFVAMSACVCVFAAILCSLHARELIRTRKWSLSTHEIITMAPSVAFCTVNALAFAAAASLVHIRYTIFAHTFLLLLFYIAALRWLLSR